MKDLVLRQFVSSFAESTGLEHLDQPDQLTHFACSTILRKNHGLEELNPERFIVDGEGDAGIDAIAILVNGRPVFETSDVDYLYDKLRRLDVDFVFIQTKSSDSFSAGEIGTFTFGVEQFFGEEPSIPLNAELSSAHALKSYIYTKSIQMDQNPNCHLYFTAAGQWKEPNEPAARIRDGEKKLRNTQLFTRATVRAIDAEALKGAYRELERGTIREVELSRTAVFPKVNGVNEAYIGLMNGDQFIKLVADEQGCINRGLFYDNVRDFQGHNPVNQEITQTLSAADSRERFALLNNGVTIVAREIKRTGDSFRVADFQIVNGCQTTHVIFEQKDKIGSDTLIPVKLLATADSRIISEVVKATNRQTPVLPEALESLRDFHKELEDYYLARESSREEGKRIYYERRSKQYAFEKISPSRIVTLASQVSAFVTMFLDEPHSQHRYYGELLKSYESRLFLDDHEPSPYYTSAISFLRIQALFNAGKLPKKHRNFRPHVLMLIRVLAGGPNRPRLNNKKKIDSYCNKILEAVSTRDKLTSMCEEALAIIESKLSAFDGANPHPTRLKAFTAALLGSNGSVPQKPSTNTLQGKITHYDQFKRFGYIESSSGEDYSFRDKNIADVPHRLRHRGTRVLFIAKQREGEISADSIRLDLENQPGGAGQLQH